MHKNILRFARGRYLLIASALTLACILLYLTQRGDAIQPPNGGTWQGYTLGTIGALLIVWLSLLGIRKRRYHSTLGSVQGWTSAHVYLGTALLIIATLHCAFQFGWNIHTLAYALMTFVIVSGFYGIYAYIQYPRVAAQNRAGFSREALFAELNQLNNRGRELAQLCDAEVGGVIESAIQRTVIGGGLRAQLLTRDRSQILFRGGQGGGQDGGQGANKPQANADQQAVIDFIVKRVPRARKSNEADSLQQLLGVLSRRQVVLRRLRKDIQLQAFLQLWLYIHVPMTIALLGALVAHIFSVLFYW
jgi:hypothetical protein